jgi:hypothetical protein
MRRSNLVTVYPDCFARIQSIAWKLHYFIEKLLKRSDEEGNFDQEVVTIISNGVGTLLNYWDCFDNDYEKVKVPSVIQETIDQQVTEIRNDFSNLENETEQFIETYSKRQLYLMGQWILYIIDILE